MNSDSCTANLVLTLLKDEAYFSSFYLSHELSLKVIKTSYFYWEKNTHLVDLNYKVELQC